MGLGALTPLFEQVGKGAPIANPQDIQLKQAALQNQQAQNLDMAQQARQRFLQNQQMQQQLDEYKTIQNYVGQNGGGLSAALQPGSPLEGQVSPGTMLALRKTDADTQNTAATAQKSHADALEAEQRTAGLVQKGIQDYKNNLATWANSMLQSSAPPAAVFASLDDQAAGNSPHAQAINQLKQSLMQDPAKIPAQLQFLVGQASPDVAEQFQRQAAAPIANAETQARTGLTNTQNQAAQLELQNKQKLLGLPDASWNNAVDAVAGGDQEAAQTAKAQVQFYRAQGNLEKANDVIDALAKAKNATREDVIKQGLLAPGEVDKAVKVEKATAPIKTQQEIDAEVGRQAATDSNLDRDVKQFGAPYQKAMSDADTQLEKIASARSMINGPAEGQALGIPKVLTAVVGGQGSGVRITQPEQNAILKARGIGGDLQGFINSLSGHGKLTATQQQQLTGILDDARDKLMQKRQIVSGAVDAINGAKDRNTIIGADKQARDRISAMENGLAKGGAPQVPKALLKAPPGIHTLSDGTTWKKDLDGTVTRQ